ncbi:MAG: hypothetical protein GX657_09570 [Chloroflexi bacterium]|nr:hypothetical protein [Chloroflexota bacterium]
MSYFFSVRGWLEISWPDLEIEGVDESPAEHADKVTQIRDLLTTRLTPEEILAPDTPPAERCRAGWGFPQSDLDGTEYVFFAGDVEEPAAVLAQVREVLAIDPFADGFFTVEGEDGEEYRQWLVMGGKIYVRQVLFPDFEAEEPPEGFRPLFD